MTPHAVLTAASCLDHNVDKITVYAGGDSLSEFTEMRCGVQKREAKSVYIHPEYKKKINEYNNLTIFENIAIVKVSEAFEMTCTVKTLKVGKRPLTQDSYKTCTFTGFGKVYYNVSDADDNTRKTHYLEFKGPCSCFTHTEGILLCSRPREDYGICTGDIGGGLVCDGVLVAVAIAIVEYWDINMCSLKKTEGCGLKNTISLFQETGYYLKWINRTVNRGSTDRCCHQVPIVLLVTTLYYITY